MEDDVNPEIYASLTKKVLTEKSKDVVVAAAPLIITLLQNRQSHTFDAYWETFMDGYARAMASQIVSAASSLCNDHDITHKLTLALLHRASHHAIHLAQEVKQGTSDTSILGVIDLDTGKEVLFDFRDHMGGGRL
jgi:hypothetical protein